MATYLINNTLTSSTGKIPNEVFFNKKVNISDLKLFGSPVMVHINKEKRSKLDAKAEKLIFVGYDHTTKGFRCVHQKTGKLTISRDVIFHEPITQPPIMTGDSTTEEDEIEDSDSDTMITVHGDGSTDDHQNVETDTATEP